MDVAGRLPRLRERLEAAGCDALLVTNLANIRYLTGFTGSAAFLLVGQSTLFTTDGRYGDQSSEELGAAGVEAETAIGRRGEQIEALEKPAKGLRVGVEAENLTMALKEEFECVGSRLVPTAGVVEGLRRVKDAGELARIEAAADIADVALAQLKERLASGVTEAQFALELDFEMRQRGADGVSFETIVASGPNGALPHARPSDRLIEAGDVVVIDFGALVDGYHSDMTRTFSIGPPASAELVDVSDAVLVAQRAGVRALKPGVSCSEVDAACRDSLELAGYGSVFLHPTGHGVGLDIHEAPAVAAGSADILEEGVVVTVEPGAYLTGVGGVRIEDSLVITATGARALTKSTKDAIL
jgi:Xaa-Pro aminopeptidase